MECHDPEEFAAAMAALTRVEKLRLRQVQQIFSRPPLMEGADLLNEVYVRVFNGTRRWYVGKDVLTFVIGAMRSLADEATERVEREQVTAGPGFRQAGEPLVEGIGFTNHAGVVSYTDPSVTPEDGLVASEERKLIADYRQRALEELADDEKAQLLLEGMLDGIKGRELQELVEMDDDTAFASKQKLVKRRLEKLARDIEARRKSA